MMTALDGEMALDRVCPGRIGDLKMFGIAGCRIISDSMKGRMMSKYLPVGIIVIGLLFFSVPVSAADDFLLGVSQGAEEAVPYLRELGIHWGRMSISWKDVMPEVSDPLLSLDEVLDNDDMVEELALKTDWSEIDRLIRYRLDNGVQPIPTVGCGWHNSYPDYHGKPAHPQQIGKDHYLAYMYLYVRTVVERYDGDGYLDADGIRIKLWQTENELNQAGLTAGWGWRKPTWMKGLTSCWADWDFLTELLGLLYRAVKDADPQARTYMNFHTDIPDRVSRLFSTPAWTDAVAQWQELMDIIGFDAYPNYYTADSVRGELVGERVRIIKSIVPDKPVIVVETDYPYGPSIRGFTPEKQAQYLRTSFDSARQAGADGYMTFRVMDDNAGKYDPLITEKDLRNLDRIVPWWEQGKVFRLLVWAIPRAGYIKGHFLGVLQAIEDEWGYVDHQGNKLPAYQVMKEIVQESR
jgi:hypothetical protein